jgi:hypothetical protein
MADSKWGLIVVEADHLREDVAKSVEMSASETAIAPGTCVLTTFNPTEDVTHEVEEGDQFQGLAFNEIKFVGNDLTRTSDSKTSRLVGPRLATATEMPGIDPNRLGLAK